MDQILDTITKEHNNTSEYLSVYRELLPLMAKEYNWKKCDELIDFFYKKLIPHFEAEEKIFEQFLSRRPKRKLLKIILKLQREHLEILEMFGVFAQKVRSIDTISEDKQIELTYSGIALIDTILQHADFEDKNLLPLLKP